ncbi:MAG: methyltransferase domain-containing protein [Acidobacteriia bacterium]|nr:methyltransferase domain-containing protein [Terriglobia bacterium]
MTDSSTHKQRIQEEFTKQARAYASSADIHDPARLLRLVSAVDPSPNSRVLEIATGPGYVALSFAAHCREVVGVDITAAPLAIAEETRLARGLNNVSFRLADADHLPFSDGEFDVVVCRLAFHHFEAPETALQNMTRLCRVDGTVAVEDLAVSEHPQRAEYQNRFERLRDPSHVKARTMSELLSMFTANDLEVTKVYTDQLTPSVERWLANSRTPPKEAAEVRRMIEEDLARDLSGTRPFRTNGELFFNQKTVAIIGRKMRRAP